MPKIMSNSDKPMTLEETKAAWEASVIEQGAQYPNHTKKEFTFTQTEARQLLRIATVQTLIAEAHKIDKGLIDDLLNNNVLPRIGIIPSEEKHILFEPTLGRFVIWEPKVAKSKKN